MTPPQIKCPKCQATLLLHPFNSGSFHPCPACNSDLQVEIFPALFRKFESGRTGEAVLAEGEASCFYHPAKKAVLPCDGCGRFLCALCDCEHQGQHLCPTCLELGRTKGKIKGLESKRTRYDNLALSLAVVPLLPALTVVLFFVAFVTLVTAPLALYVVIRHWRSPFGLTQRSRIKFILAAVIASLEIGAWVAFLIAMLTR